MASVEVTKSLRQQQKHHLNSHHKFFSNFATNKNHDDDDDDDNKQQRENKKESAATGGIVVLAKNDLDEDDESELLANSSQKDILNMKNSNNLNVAATLAATNNHTKASTSAKLKKEIDLPKTLATGKGALILFSEDFVSKSNNKDYFDEKSTLSLNDLPIKTVSDLKKNVLFYGLDSYDKISTEFDDRFIRSNKSDTNISNNYNRQLLESNSNDELPFNTFSILKMSTKSLLNSKHKLNSSTADGINLNTSNEQSNVVVNTSNEEVKKAHPPTTKRINRGFSARHYLRSLTKNWDQKLLDTFISDGKINQETIYEKNDRITRKKRVEDDLSLWPQAYKFDQSWISATIDMRTFKFIKAQEFYTAKLNKDEKIVKNEYSNNNNLGEMQKNESNNNNNKRKLITEDPIKIFDQKLTEVSYKALSFFEKQKVLTELLFQSALNNLKRHRIDLIEDFTDNSKIQFQAPADATPSFSKEPSFHHSAKKKPHPTPAPATSLSNLFESKSQNKFTDSTPTSFQNNRRSKTNDRSKGLVSFKNEPVYMFGKYTGAPWVYKKPTAIDSQINIREKEASSSTFAKVKPTAHSTELTLDEKTVPNTASASKHEQRRKILHNDEYMKENYLHSHVKDDLSASFDFNIEKIKNTPMTTLTNEFQLLNEILTLNENENIKIDNEIVNEEINEHINKLADNLDQLMSLENMLESDEKLTTIEIAMEELKSLKSSSEHFVLKDGDSLLNFDLKDESIAEMNENEAILDEKSKKELKPSDDSQVESDPLKHIKEISRRNLKLERLKHIELNQQLQKNRNLQETSTEQGPPNDSLNDKENLKLMRNLYSIDKRTKSPANRLKSNIDLIYKESENKLLSKETNENTLPNLVNDQNTTPNIKRSPLTAQQAINEVARETMPMRSGSNIKKLTSSILNSNKGLLRESLMRQSKENRLDENHHETHLLGKQEKNFLPKLTKDNTQPNMLGQSFDAAKNAKEEGSSAFFDGEYAKVEMMKLKPRADSTELLRKKVGIDNKRMLLKRPEFDFSQKYNNLVSNEQAASTKIEKEQEERKPAVANETERKRAEPLTYPIQGLLVNNQENLNYQSNFGPKTKITNLFERVHMHRRNIDWTCGDFDPRECFVLWSYNPPIVVDKVFAECLKRYAQLIAKNVLGGKYGGISLSEDIKRALQTNMDKLKLAIEQGKIGREVIEEYKKIFKNVLAKTLKRKDLENIEIDDEMLLKLLELPPHAFEIFTDPISGLNRLRVRSAYLREQAKFVRTVVTEKNITMDDFDVEIDPLTGEKRMRLKADVARKLGIPEGAEDLIEVFTDEFGNQVMRLKDGAKTVKIGNTEYELVLDPNTGQYVLKMTTQQKVGEENIDDVMRLAANMSPETRHRYFQDLLKQSGEKMSDELRRQIIDEMLKNANNLAPETRDNLLKDLMVNLVNTLPKDLAAKVLSDIMKSTDNLDSNLKEQMIRHLLQDLDELPSGLKERALHELIRNMDSLSSDAKHALLQDILNKVEEMGDTSKLDPELKNQVLKEILKNSQNFDEETRHKIIQQVLDKLASDGNADMPSALLEELVKQMGSLPEEIKNKVMQEIKKNIEKGGLDSSLLAELLKNPANLTAEIFETLVNNTDKMDSSTLKELMKNLDRLPDALKAEMISKMANNLENMDNSVKQELLKELLANPNLIKDEALREKLIKEIMNNLTPTDILKELENMTAEEKNKYLQDLLKRAGDLNEETRQKIIAMLIDNAQHLDQETRDNLLKDLVENVIKDLPPDMAAKVLSELMKTTENLDASLKQKMIENLLNNVDNLSEELKQQTLQEVIKNLNDLSADQKEALFKVILSNADDNTIKELMNNMNNLSSEQKNQLLQNILDKVEKEGVDSEIAKNLRNQVLKEIVKNSKDLDDETRSRILKDVIEKFKAENGVVPDMLLEELVKQMNDLPDSIKDKVIDELKKNIEKSGGKIAPSLLSELLKNPSNIPKELLSKVIDNINQLEPEALKELVKNLDKLPDELKEKAIGDMIKNISNLDPNVQKELLKELMKNPDLIKDKAVLDKAILDLVDNLDKLPDDVKKDMMKNIAKNINKLSNEVKKKVLKEVFNSLKNSNEETRGDVLKQLLKNMGQKELEEWIKNSDMSDEMKQKMLEQLNIMIQNGDDLLDSDDEAELAGLTGEERSKKKRQLIDKKKVDKNAVNDQDQPKWQDTLRGRDKEKKDLDWLKKNKNNILKDMTKDSDLNDEQIDFIKAFNKLSEEEKAKLMESMNREERYALNKLQDEYAKLRQRELEEALLEAKRAAIARLREELTRRKKLQYINFLRIESNLLNHSQQISRAFVFSYFDLLGWLDVSV